MFSLLAWSLCFCFSISHIVLSAQTSVQVLAAPMWWPFWLQLCSQDSKGHVNVTMDWNMSSITLWVYALSKISCIISISTSIFFQICSVTKQKQDSTVFCPVRNKKCCPYHRHKWPCNVGNVVVFCEMIKCVKCCIFDLQGRCKKELVLAIWWTLMREKVKTGYAEVVKTLFFMSFSLVLFWALILCRFRVEDKGKKRKESFQFRAPSSGFSTALAALRRLLCLIYEAGAHTVQPVAGRAVCVCVWRWVHTLTGQAKFLWGPAIQLLISLI